MKAGFIFLIAATIFLLCVNVFSGERNIKIHYIVVLKIVVEHNCELSFVSDDIELTIEVSENFYNSHKLGERINNESKTTPNIAGTGRTEWVVIIKSKKVVMDN